MSDYKPINCSFYDYLEAFAVRKRNCTIVYHDENGNRNSVNGVISDLFIKDKAEFLLMDNNVSIRLDKIISLDDILLSDANCDI